MTPGVTVNSLLVDTDETMADSARRYNPATAKNIEKARKLQQAQADAKNQAQSQQERDSSRRPPSGTSSLADFSADPTPHDNPSAFNTNEDARYDPEDERLLSALKADIFDQLDDYSFSRDDTLERDAPDRRVSSSMSNDNRQKQYGVGRQNDSDATTDAPSRFSRQTTQNGGASAPYDYLDTGSEEGMKLDFDPGDDDQGSRRYSAREINSSEMRERYARLFEETTVPTVDRVGGFDFNDASHSRHTSQPPAAPTMATAAVATDTIGTRLPDFDRPSTNLNGLSSAGNPFLSRAGEPFRRLARPDDFLSRVPRSPGSDIDPDRQYRPRRISADDRDDRDRPSNPTPSTRAAGRWRVAGAYTGLEGFRRRGSDRREYRDIVGDESVGDEDDVDLAGQRYSQAGGRDDNDNGTRPRSQTQRQKDQPPTDADALPDLPGTASSLDRLNRLLNDGASESFHVAANAFDLLSASSASSLVDIDADPIDQQPATAEVSRAVLDTPSRMMDLPQHRPIVAVPGESQAAIVTVVHNLQEEITRLESEKTAAVKRTGELEAENETYRQLLYKEQVVRQETEARGKGGGAAGDGQAEGDDDDGPIGAAERMKLESTIENLRARNDKLERDSEYFRHLYRKSQDERNEALRAYTEARHELEEIRGRVGQDGGREARAGSRQQERPGSQQRQRAEGRAEGDGRPGDGREKEAETGVNEGDDTAAGISKSFIEQARKNRRGDERNGRREREKELETDAQDHHHHHDQHGLHDELFGSGRQDRGMDAESEDSAGEPEWREVKLGRPNLRRNGSSSGPTAQRDLLGLGRQAPFVTGKVSWQVPLGDSKFTTCVCAAQGAQSAGVYSVQ
ncbi:hypothetical protein BC937DRAFT_93100 [Endogone sp. FLAS-F59071]|nr:hypothetical protein BC937DRAFT_93100 [Endogone sp. FLAS-F59071]|eukprot:RUS21297.1 hypothetical protein BC937DRAFT_93100 [Endogone sp. FLAS-F59071]